MAKPTYVTGDVPPALDFNEWFVGVNFARKVSNQPIVASTTLVNDNALVVSVLANAIYVVDCVIKYDAPQAGDFKIGWTAPSGATFEYGCSGQNTGSTDYTGDQTAQFSLAATPGFGGISAGVTNQAVIIKGLLITSGTAGSLQLQVAQNSASGTTTVQAGSFLDLCRRS